MKPGVNETLRLMVTQRDDLTPRDKLTLLQGYAQISQTLALRSVLVVVGQGDECYARFHKNSCTRKASCWYI